MNAIRSLVVVVLVALAGCSGAVGPGTDTATTSTSGTDAANRTTIESTGDYSVRVVSRHSGSAGSEITFYVSDEENAIGDFRHLNVSVTRVGFHRATEGGNGSEGGWVERDVDDRTVDLTRLRGANATRLTTIDAPDGRYDKVFAYVGDVNATLTSGEQVRVKLPSEKLQIKKQFAVGANESVDFVFDIAVHKAGKSGKYILKPVISQSGTDVPMESVDEDDEDAAPLDVAFVGNVTRGGNATVEVTRNETAVANATVTVDGEERGTTDADGRLTFGVPDAKEVTVTVTEGESEVELELEFESGNETESEEATTEIETETETETTESPESDDGTNESSG